MKAKRIISTLLALVMILPMAVSGISAAAPWGGMTDYAAPTVGVGTPGSPFEISTPEHLAWLSYAVENKSVAEAFVKTQTGKTVTFSAHRVFADYYFEQTADIDLGGGAFLPIGAFMQSGTVTVGGVSTNHTNRHAFSGIYDGGGYAVRNAVINVQDHMDKSYFNNTLPYQSTLALAKSAYAYVDGLFGVVNGGMIRNVHLENVQVGSHATSVSGIAGGIVGLTINATVEGCSVDASSSVTASEVAGGIVGSTYFTQSTDLITGCSSAATVSGGGGDHHHTGGIVGIVPSPDEDAVNAETGAITASYRARVVNCTNSGAIYTADRVGSQRAYAGGIAGTNHGTVSGCTNTGDLDAGFRGGGIVGNNCGTVSDCTNSGAITTRSAGAGGIVSVNDTANALVEGSTNTGKISAADRAGGIIAYTNTASTVKSCVNLGTVSGKNDTGGIAGCLNAAATVDGCINNGEVNAPSAASVGGIVGNLLAPGATVTGCVNNRSVLGRDFVGGIVGSMKGASVTWCVNNGSVENDTTTRWRSVGGIVGIILLDTAKNTVSYCVNKGKLTARLDRTSDNYRVSLGGIVGDDSGYDASVGAVIVDYSYCYNLADSFDAHLTGSGSDSYLIPSGGIVGWTADAKAASDTLNAYYQANGAYKTYTHCYTVAGTTNEYRKNEQSATPRKWEHVQDGDVTYGKLANGIISGTVTVDQLAWGLSGGTAIGLDSHFATCKYYNGINPATSKTYTTAEAIGEMAESSEYRAIIAALPADTSGDLRFIGVQDSLIKGESYDVRFIAGIDSLDYYAAGFKVRITSQAGAMTEYVTLTDSKVYTRLVGIHEGNAVTYDAKDYGVGYFVALSVTDIDLTQHGAVTFEIIPVTVAEKGATPVEGNRYTVTYDENGGYRSCTGEGLKSFTVDASYSITYNKNTVLAANYPAVALQYHCYRRGLTLALNPASPTPNEIRMEENAAMPEGVYTVAREGDDIVVTAGDQFGFIGAAEYLTKTLFRDGLSTAPLWPTHLYRGVYSREMLSEKTGENRVIFQNAWYRGGANSELFNSVTGYEYQLALVETYRPDVIGLNEYLAGWRASGFADAMKALGYIEVKPQRNGADVDLGNPIFYNSKTVKYVEGSSKYISYGACTFADSDGDGILEVQRHSSGKYWDNSESNETAHAATFENAKGERFTVCCTHLEANNNVDPQVAPLGNQLRLEQVERLVAFLKSYQAEYGATVLVGGDYNSADSYSYKSSGYSANGDTNPWYFDRADKSGNHSGGYATSLEDHKANPNKALTTYTYHDGSTKEYLWGACDELRANGFINTRNETADTAYNGSTHGYPVWNSDLKAYVDYSASLNDTAYTSSIDHVYALEISEGELETVTYRNLTVETILSSSDHKPVMIDFELKTASDAKYKDSDLEGDTWQGMNDYAAPTEGSGSEADPYLISRPEHLAWLARATNDIAWANAFLGRVDGLSRSSFESVFFKQTADIDLAGLAFTPIGNYQCASDFKARHGFGGTYDGGGFVIKNARINACADNGQTATAGYSSDTYVSGIFGLLSPGTLVKNVNAQNVKVGTLLSETASTSAATFGETFAGVIVGIAIEASVTGCSTDADCAAIGVYAGGIVAFQNNCTDLSYCVNRATVIGDKAAGGIVGAAECMTISYNVNHADLHLITFHTWGGVGGIIGVYSGLTAANENAVSNCINKGNLNATDRQSSGSNHRLGMGGIVGNDNTAVIASYENCFNLAGAFTAKVEKVGNVTNFLACVGGLAGYARDAAGVRSYKNVYTVAGSVDTDYFGTAIDFGFDWEGMNGTPKESEKIYAGIMTGELNDTQVTRAITNNASAAADTAKIQDAFADCYYGVEASEIEGNATYQEILAAL